MNEILMDDSLYWLSEAQRYLDMIVDIDPYQEIFETYDPNVKLKVDQNEKAKTGVAGSLKKAIEAVKRICKNIMNSIKDFFEKRNLKEEERKAYDSFKAACAKNPELKNKKISVKDYRKFNEEYNNILEEARKADTALAEERAFNTQELFDRISGFTKGIASGAVASVGCDAALNMASSSREIANNIYASLKNDQALHDRLEAAIGKAETKRFEKQMKSLGKRVSLQRAIMKMKGTYSRSIDEALSNTYHNVIELATTAADTGTSIAKDNTADPRVSITGNVFQRAANTAKTVGAAAKNMDKIADTVKAANKTDIVRHLAGNKEVQSAAKAGIKGYNKSVKDARRTYKNQKKADRRRRLNAALWRTSDQSALDSLLGVNNPDSK